MGEVRNRNIRIGIVDNDQYALKVFGALIERMSSDFAVIWTCDLGAVAISRCLSPAKRPDVLVTDMSMGDVPGTEVCRAIRAKTPEVGLVGVTSYALASFHDEAVRCGAQALVGKTDLNGIALAIRNAAQGLPTNELVPGDEGSCNSLSFMDAATAYVVLEDTSYAHRGALSGKERDTLRMYADGATTKEIAGRLGISVAIPWHDGGSDTMSGSADGAASSSALDGSVAGGSSSSSGSDSAGQSGSDSTGSADESIDSSAEHRTGQVILGAIALYGVIPVAVLFIGFMLGGMAARWNHERSLARAELAHRRQQERTAQDIHDYVSNDLAYLILRFDKDIADGRTLSEEELRELRSMAMGALDRTHQVIDVIEGRGEAAHSAVTPHDSTVDAAPGIACDVTDADCPLAEQIRDVASNGDRRLSELGFEGQTIISGAHGVAGRSDLIAGLLEELYGNIAKHADSEAGYVMTIGIGLDTVRIACIDTARTPSDSDADGSADLSNGTGLSRYRQLLERQNGALHVTTQDAEWTLSAVIPL